MRIDEVNKALRNNLWVKYQFFKTLVFIITEDVVHQEEAE